MKMEPIVSSETSAIRTQTPGNYPKRNKLHLEHGESLKTRLNMLLISVSREGPNSNLSRYATSLDVSCGPPSPPFPRNCSIKNLWRSCPRNEGGGGAETWLQLNSTSAQDGGEWSASRPGRFIPKKELRYPLNRRLDGPLGPRSSLESLYKL